MIYKIGVEPSHGGKFMGSAYDDERKLEAYKKGDWIYVYQGKDRLGEYDYGRFTTLDSLYMASVGIDYAENTNDFSDEDWNDLEEAEFDSVDIPDSDENEYTI